MQKQTNPMKIFSQYLKHHRKTYLTFLIFISVFALIFILYNLPIEAFLYSVLIFACLGAALTAVDFARYYKRLKILEGLREQIIFSISELPLPKNLLEFDYNVLIKIINDEKNRTVSEADRESTEMNDFYTLWAHQIKTPIAAMRLLLQSDKNEKDNQLDAELFKIEQYIEMVLSYCRIGSSSSDFVIKSCELDRLVKQAIRKYAQQFIIKKISLDFNATGCSVVTDEKWLAFVIEQILSNSLKYTQKGSISIYMEGSNLVIQDTGIGIAKEDLPRIFEKGFTGYNGRIDKKSTGIGLYLCKKILNKLSHSINVESEPGTGTKVIIGLYSGDATHGDGSNG